MKTILRVLLTAFAVLILANLLDGVSVANYESAVIVAIVLGLLRITVRPLFVILTLPVTVLTLGLFLFVINALIVLMADRLIDGFNVSGLWTAMLFSLLLSVFQSILFSFLKKTN